MSGTKVHRGSGLGGGKPSAELRADADRSRDQAPCTTRCAFCGWAYTGTVHEGRELARGHRRVHHPDAIQTRRRRVSLNRHVNRDDSWREEGLARAKVVAASLARLEEAS
jgi:hypothetical protein